MRYVALLRAINVGGKNLMRMADVRACLEEREFECVSTYIQSGNILFESKSSNVVELATAIEKAFEERFGQNVPVFLRSQRQMRTIVADAPNEWSDSDTLRRSVAFLRKPLTSAKALQALRPRANVDSVKAGDGVVYMTTVLAHATQSGLSKVVGTSIYRDMTIRNYTTCQKILALMASERA